MDWGVRSERHISKGDHRMGIVNPDDPDATPTDKAVKPKLRGRLAGLDRDASLENTDTTLRLDDEDDTLYEDGLEVDDDSPPLTGIDGKDDTQ
jgi:hypothetical protein